MSADLDMMLLDYATGAMAEGPALAVATKLAMDPDARADYEALELTGGALLDGLAPEAVSERLLAATLDRLDSPMPRVAAAMPDAETRRLLPRPLWRYVPEGLESLRWRSWGRNVREAVLPLADRGHRATLLQVKGGHGVMNHTHEGREYTLVLSGSFHDETGHYRAGAFQICDGDVRHRPVADKGADCLCLAVLDAPMHFTGLLGKFINPKVRF